MYGTSVIQTAETDPLTVSSRTELLFQLGKSRKEGKQSSKLRKKADLSSMDLFFFIPVVLLTAVNAVSK